MLRPTALACALLLALPALACGPAPHPANPSAASRCGMDALFGDWIGSDDSRIRFIDSRDRGFSLLALRRESDGGEDTVVYSRVKWMRGCKFAARRHVGLDEGLHAAPPHAVILTLDPEAGLMADDYGAGATLTWRRATPRPSPPAAH